MEIAFSIIIVSLFVVLLMMGLLHVKGLGVGLDLKILSALCMAAGLSIMLFTPQFFRRLRTGFSTNVAATSLSPEFPELKTRFYSASPDQVFKASAAAIGGLKNWKVTHQDNATGVILAEKKVVIFIDDVAIKIRADGGRTRVDVFSKSRVGKGDFGENRRHVAEFLESLDRELHSD